MHEGKKPFQCEICSAEFSGRHTLKNHIRKSHEDSIKPNQINDTNKAEKKKTKTKTGKEKRKLQGISEQSVQSNSALVRM